MELCPAQDIGLITFITGPGPIRKILEARANRRRSDALGIPSESPTDPFQPAVLRLTDARVNDDLAVVVLADLGLGQDREEVGEQVFKGHRGSFPGGLPPKKTRLGGSEDSGQFPSLRIRLAVSKGDPWSENDSESPEAASDVVASRPSQHRRSYLRTQMERILERAGIKPWPKLFQNLRSSRESELMKVHGVEVACAWIGNTPAVATKYYLQITDEDYELALKAWRELNRHAG